jgi:xylan 1,4-beta-xylosidase
MLYPVKTYRNPVNSGFHPDPSVVRAGEWYYMVHSSLHWFPGIPIYRSRDLVHWHPVGYALTRDSQLDLRGVSDSLGVWAPDIGFFDGLFYIAYTDMRRYDKHNRRDRVIENKVVTAEDPVGPWSDPVIVNGSGIDPSIFRDDDDRAYFINQAYGPDTYSMGIVCQEFDLEEKRLLGEPRLLWPGSGAGYTEGPHLYKRGVWYYLLTAEGGTYHEHQCSIARSRSLWGPYETKPGVSILTMRDRWRDVGISRSGHGDFIEEGGDLRHIAFLAARPYGGRGCANLGRETFLLPVSWSAEGWPVVNENRGVEWECPFPNLPEDAPYDPTGLDSFEGGTPGFEWNTSRNPDPSRLSLSEHPGFLRIRGSEYSLDDLRHENLVARRQRSIDFTAETVLEFNPADERAEAGLACYYDTRDHITLEITRSGGTRIVRLAVHRADPGQGGAEIGSDHIVKEVPLPGEGAVVLRVEARGQSYRFFAGLAGGSVTQVGVPVDGSILSDEHAVTFGWGFTGAFVGMYAVDLSGAGTLADFSGFLYEAG